MLTFQHYLFELLMLTINTYLMILFVFLLSSLVYRNRRARWLRFLAAVCEPPLAWIRRLSKGRVIVGQFDLSPLVLFFALSLLKSLIQILFSA